MLKKIKLILLFVSISFNIVGADEDSLSVENKKSVVSYYNQHQFEHADSLQKINISLSDFQNYLPFNNLGNFGLTYNPLFYRNTTPIGFNYFQNNYSNYFLSPDNIKYYNVRSPFTDLFYVAGSKKEQLFRLTFSYNIKKNWNTTLNFNRVRSDGFYFRQNTNNNAVALSTNYKSNNNRYFLLGTVILNSAKNAENGGIPDSTIVGSVNLNKANRKTIHNIISVKQYFNFGEKVNDSTNSISQNPSSRIILTSSYENNILTYSDESLSKTFYENIYFDSLKTHDSVFHYKVNNELVWKRLDNGKRRGYNDMFGVLFSARHEFAQIRQRQSLFSYNNVILGTQLYNTYSNNNLFLNIGGNYTLNGYNQNDYVLRASASKSIRDNKGHLLLLAEQKRQAPDFIYNHYYSNHFFWNNNFDKTLYSKIQCVFSLNDIITTGGDYTVVKNLMYFNEEAVASQYSSVIPVFHAFLKKDFSFYNWHLNNRVDYNLLPSTAAIRLPEFILEHTLYYENKLFDKHMNFQIGASVFYVSEYYANAYMPVTAQFYLQNTVKTAGYPAINFFINTQIKDVRVFIKLDHLNDGFMQNSYVLTPNYPMNGRAFKFGVSWLFWD